MKILFVLDSLQGGGFERRMSQLIKGLTNKTGDLEVSIVFPEGARVDYEDILTKTKVSYYKTQREFNQIVGSIKPDIVHSCSPYKSLALNLLKIKYRFKLIVGFIADANRPPLLSKRNIGFSLSYPLADAIISNSMAGLIAYRCPLKKSHVIYNGFEPSRLDIDISQDLVRDQQQFKYIINMTGRIGEDKDFKAFIDIADRLKDRKEILFYAVGKGKYEDIIKEYCDSKKLHNVRFLGFRSDVINIFKVSYISLLLSTVGKHKEGVSNSIMESMATGTPVIATNDGGSPEIIKDGSNGFLIDNNNLDMICDKIEFLLNDCESYKAFSKEAEKTIRDRFLLSTMVDNYIDLYRKLKNV